VRIEEIMRIKLEQHTIIHAIWRPDILLPTIACNDYRRRGQHIMRITLSRTQLFASCKVWWISDHTISRLSLTFILFCFLQYHHIMSSVRYSLPSLRPRGSFITGIGTRPLHNSNTNDISIHYFHRAFIGQVDKVNFA